MFFEIMTESYKYPITFILPTYNVENYLAECLDSILQQSIEKEIIIVNDGSTDNSLSIALDYAKHNPNIIVLHSQNKGASSARNLGLQIAQGEYVIWIDPDDYLNQKLNLEHIYQLAKINNMNVIKGQFDYFSQESPEEIKTNLPINPNAQGETAVIQPLKTFYKNVLATRWFIQIGCFMIKKDFLQKNKLQFEESLEIGEDGLFYIDLYLKDEKIMEVPYSFITYRIHNDSIMRRPFSSKRIEITQKMLSFIKERLGKANTEEEKGLLNATLGLYSYYLHLDIIEDDDIKKEYEHLITPEFISFYSSFGISPPA